MTSPTPDAENILDRVHEYRVAARTIVGTEHATIARRCEGLLELVEMARLEADLTIRTWAERSIWEESKAFLGMNDEGPPLPPEGYERRQRRLRAEGYETCPHCFARIATEEEQERWSSLRMDAAERRCVREEAVS
jgi:hypothetical protein